MRVAMITSRCFPYMGGIETHVHEVVPRLVDRGVEVEVLTSDPSGKLDRSEVVDGALVRRFGAWPAGRDYYFCPDLLRYLSAGRYDVVHVQGVHNLLAPTALAVATHKKMPTVLTFHTGGNSSALRTRLRTAQWRMIAPILGRTTQLIAVCEYEAGLFRRALGRRVGDIALVRNGSEPLPVEPSADIGVSGSPLIVSVGRLERYKGHHRVVVAMSALTQLAPEAKLAIVGSGPYEAELRRLVAEQALDEQVVFKTFAPIERGALGSLVASADLMVLMSEYEAHPVAVMEALALGRDVLCADTSGLSELETAGLIRTAPLLSPPDDLARRMLEVSAEHRWRLAPPQLPSWDDCASALYEVYEKVVKCAS
jgi:glycosyltransferase involved in cell wall biosynthesis